MFVTNKQMDKGYLSVILGCMFSGKTSKLISIYKHNKLAEISTCVVNYIDDTRYDKKLMSTHDGVKIECKRVRRIYDIFNDVENNKKMEKKNKKKNKKKEKAETKKKKEKKPSFP